MSPGQDVGIGEVDHLGARWDADVRPYSLDDAVLYEDHLVRDGLAVLYVDDVPGANGDGLGRGGQWRDREGKEEEAAQREAAQRGGGRTEYEPVS